MKRLFAVLLAVVLTTASFAVQDSNSGKNANKAKSSAARSFRWHGIIQRHNEQNSTLDVAREGVVRVVVYSDSTQWVNHGKPADAKDFTDGADVIVFGTLDKSGRVIAHRIDLRRK